jgi:hypothetical protein
LSQTRQRETPRSRTESQAGAAPPSVSEALARARWHVRAAIAEALLALRALLDALSCATHGGPAGARQVLTRAAASLDMLSDALASGDRIAEPALVHALADALDAEIVRWETRARDDEEARAVLRAFLGLRELLWELGVRPARGERSRAASPVRKRSVEHVPVHQG